MTSSMENNIKPSMRDLPHEVVNPSEWEIVNAKGYTTNAIEAKWGVLKRG